MHEAKCTQATQRDSGARQRAKEAHLAAPWALIGYFFDPVLFEMLAASARLQLPNEPFHVPRWRQASLLHFTLNVHHVRAPGITYGMAQPPVSVTGKASAGMGNHAAAAPNAPRPADG